MPFLDAAELAAVASELRTLRADMLHVERIHALPSAMQPEDQASARNFLHYLALRQRDLRSLQERLARLGLSSLGRAEAHVLASVDAVLGVLDALQSATSDRSRSESGHALPPSAGSPSFTEGPALLARRADALLGAAPEGRAVRILVTLPPEAAEDPELLVQLLAHGTNLVRINCAHDDADVWARMIENTRRAEEKTGRLCRVSMDLGGPKLRTASGTLRDVLQDETILLTRTVRVAGADNEAGEAAAGLRPIACTLPAVLDRVHRGERVFFDDGKLGGVIEEVGPAGVRVRMTQVPLGGGKLKRDAAINLPDSDLGLRALTPRDREDLRFVARHADVVALSFVERADDIADVDAELLRLEAARKGLLLKIETRRAFDALPELLLATVGRRPVGVMIARGDLAVEVGYERLAEVQEELLWLCEAAHVPVVWATQVLERLAKKGLPTRAEITDAAMAERAECVMLNKGAHIVEAVSFLDDILRRMAAHQRKKSPRLRPLTVARRMLGRD